MTFKAILFAGILATTASSIKATQPLGGDYAQGNLLAGFTTQSGSDLIVNLGPASSVLVNGNQWNVSALLPANLIGLQNTSWGVIGVSAAPPNLVFSTAITGNTPNSVANLSAYNNCKTAATGLGGNLNSASGYGTPDSTGAGDFSWNNGTINGPGWVSAYGCSPNDTTPSSTFSTWSEDFYSTGYSTTPRQTYLGTFTLSSAGILTFNTVGGGSSASTNAYLNSLTLTPAGTLTPSFATNTFTYTATEAYGNSPTVTVINADTTATNQLIYNNLTNLLASGTASSGLTLALGSTNVVQVQVTAQDGVTIQTYTVNVIELPSLSPQPKLTNSVSGGNLNLSWGPQYLGYRLLAQTNNLSKGVSTNLLDWGTVAGTASLTATNIPIIKANLDEYYRLVYP